MPSVSSSLGTSRNNVRSAGGSRRLISRFRAARAAGPVERIWATRPLHPLVQLVVGDDVADQPHGLRRSRVDLGRGEDQEAGPGQPDGGDQAGRHVRVGQAAEQLGQAEGGSVGGDRQVAMEGQVDAAGVAHAVDPRDPELAAALDVAEGELVGAVPFDVEIGGVRGPRQIAARTEPAVRAGEARRRRPAPRDRPIPPPASWPGTCPGVKALRRSGRSTWSRSTRSASVARTLALPRSGALTGRR